MPWRGVNAKGPCQTIRQTHPRERRSPEGGPEDSTKLTEELEPQTPGGHSRVQDKPEGAPGPPRATTGALPAASVGAKSELRARGEAWDVLG